MISSLVNAQANFAINLLRETGLKTSIVISPASISIALGMALIGAKNNTAKEIQSAVLKELKDGEEIQKHFSQLLEKNKNNDSLKMVNKIYISKNLHILDAFKMGIQKYYNDCFQIVDFTKIQDLVNEINKFIAESTDNEIKNVVNSEMIHENSRMILINAIKFEKKWSSQFEVRPLQSSFYTAPDKNTTVTMMSKYCQYLNHDEYQILKVSYENESFNMFIILPRERFGLSKVIENLSATKLLNLMSSKKEHFQIGNVVIPKFEIESSFNLNKILQNLNINDAFDEKVADFSGMTEEKTFISKIIHKTRIKVSEKETKASAVTIVEKSNYEYEVTKPTFDFIADHPFLYLIADEENNIFFVGTFYND